MNLITCFFLLQHPPEELSHRDASFMEHGGQELSQVEPDVRYIYGHVLCWLQDLL